MDDDKFHQAALTAHDVFHRSAAHEFEMVAGFSNAAMRAPAIAAAGGIAAILGFVTANASVLEEPAALGLFNSALWWFFVAVMACVLAPGGAYFSQAFFVSATAAQTLHYDHPFVRQTRRSRLLWMAGAGFQVGTIGLVIAAIVALFLGGWDFLSLTKSGV